MENRIINEPINKIKEIARKSLSGHWKEMMVGIMIYYVFSSVISSILDYFFTYVREIDLGNGVYAPINVYYASPLYELIVSGPLMIGLVMFLLAFFRKHTVDYTLTFEGFSMFLKGLSLYLLYSIKILLWSLLFVIPGIIASFRYSQAFYLRVDHPEWTANQCLVESSRLMNGNKAKLFVLEISFIGWYFIAAIATGILSIFDVTGFAAIILSFICAIPVLFVDLYSLVSDTVFYELLTGNLVVNEPSPFDEFK